MKVFSEKRECLEYFFLVQEGIFKFYFSCGPWKTAEQNHFYVAWCI